MSDEIDEYTKVHARASGAHHSKSNSKGKKKNAKTKKGDSGKISLLLFSFDV